MARCQIVLDAMNRIAPKRLAEEWDNPGLLVGSPEQEVRRALLCLDVDETAVDRAIREGAQLIVAHHPLIFRPVKSLRTDRPLGRLLRKLFRHDIAVFAAHTNLDIAPGGVNDVLAERIGLVDVVAFERAAKGEDAPPPTLGRMGTLPAPLGIRAFAARVKDALGADHVRLIEAGDRPVRKVALCGGSAAEFIAKAAFLGADAYVTGDVRYHDAQHALEEGIHVIDAGHFATEFPIVHALRARLAEELRKAAPEVELLEHGEARDVFEIL